MYQQIIVYRDVYGQRKSQYDSLVKVRGVVKKYCARWFIDLENNYNKFLFAAKGKEVYDRDIPNNYFLDNFYIYSVTRVTNEICNAMC